jgi:cobalt-zinc-cadmium efflux system membrane fusion protein
MRRFLICIAIGVALGACKQKSGHPENEHAADEGPRDHVKLTPAAIERNAIRVAPVAAERLASGVVAPAEVQLNPDRTAHITPVVPGQVAEARVALGDRVERDQVLAVLRSVELGEARSAVARARAKLNVARSAFRRQEELRRESIGSERAFLEAEGALREAEAEYAATAERLRVYGGATGSGASVSIKSPLAGVVIERHATVGEVVSTERPMFVVADVGRVWVMGRVYEQDVAAVRVGEGAVVTLQAYPGRTWNGTLSYVAPTLDQASRTLPIRVELDNPDGALRPGLFGSITTASSDSAAAPVPVVPEESVQRVGGRDVVFVPGAEPGAFRAVPVATGARAGRKVEIREGVRAGDRVVVSGAFTLKSELLRSELGEHEH